MHHNDDAYATMLLCMALSPNREEYARPFSVQEFQRLVEAVHAAGMAGPGRLLGVDVSGLAAWLNLPEEEAYRAHTLLNRAVPLSYALEGFMAEGIEVVTLYDDEYPARLRRRLGAAAPAFLFRAGPAALTEMPMIAIVGISGVKTSPEARAAVEKLVEGAAGLGYGILTGGELGVSRVAGTVAARLDAPVLDVLGGDMKNHIHIDGVAGRIGSGRAGAIALEHPEAMFTVSHAIARNRVLFALADAAFVFNTDGRRGEGEAIQSRLCDWIYAWEGHPACRGLIARGAKPFGDLERLDLPAMARNWNNSQSEQLSFFDLL